MKVRTGITVVSIILPILFWAGGTQIQQSEFFQIIGVMALLFSMYAWVLSQSWGKSQILFWVFLALFCRFVLLFSLPQWSDDYFRFIWDGRLTIQGISPFASLPEGYAELGFPIKGLDGEIYNSLNSKSYYSVYPPVAQAIFASACWIFPRDVALAVFAMKLILFLFEAGTLLLMWKLLQHWGLPLQRVLIYALNPLVIVEISGNLHFEGVMVFFALLALWWFFKDSLYKAAIAIALSVSVKLVSLLMLPFLWKYLRRRALIIFTLIFFLCTLIFFSPWWSNAFLRHFGESLDLYFRQFEFNASFYNLFQWIASPWVSGNPIKVIGPLLAGISGLWIVFQVYRFQPRDGVTFGDAMLIVSCTYLFFSTTVHPWYLCFPLAWSVFSRYRFALWWSGLVVLSYYRYSTPELVEHNGLIALEYLAVFFVLIMEIRQHRSKALKKSLLP